MKTYLNLMLLLSMVFLVSACRKDADVVIPNQTITTTIQPGDWRTADNSVTYYVDIDLPEITADIHDTDGVLAYISFGNNIYEPIPQTYAGVSYTYDVSPGNMRLLVQSSRFNDNDIVNPPEIPLRLKIVLIPSSF